MHYKCKLWHLWAITVFVSESETASESGPDGSEERILSLFHFMQATFLKVAIMCINLSGFYKKNSKENYIINMQ